MSEAETVNNEDGTIVKTTARYLLLLSQAHELCRCYAADDWDDTNPTFEELLGEVVKTAQAPVRLALDAARAELAQHAALVACAREWKQQGEAHGYSSIEAAMAKGKLIDAALAVQPAASVARGEGEGEDA